MKKKPISFLIFKLCGLLGVVLFVIGIIKTINGFGQFENNDFMVGSFMITFGLFLGISGIIFGFRPEITKHSLKTAKYIQDKNKEELEKLVSTQAQIHSKAVNITAQAVKEGMSEMIYCKHCGQKIDVDSQFCKHCGQKL